MVQQVFQATNPNLLSTKLVFRKSQLKYWIIAWPLRIVSTITRKITLKFVISWEREVTEISQLLKNVNDIGQFTNRNKSAKCPENDFKMVSQIPKFVFVRTLYWKDCITLIRGSLSTKCLGEMSTKKSAIRRAHITTFDLGPFLVPTMVRAIKWSSSFPMLRKVAEVDREQSFVCLLQVWSYKSKATMNYNGLSCFPLIVRYLTYPSRAQENNYQMKTLF